MNPASAFVSSSINEAPQLRPMIGSTFRPLHGTQPTRRNQEPFDQRIETAVAALKAVVSQYAMHIPEARRLAIFEQIDSIINADDWYEDDELPRIDSFKDLLAWSIYANLPQWDSLGVDDDGDVLVAWHTEELTLTANFDGNRLVRWTSRRQAKGDIAAHAAGDCSLSEFARQAKFYLQGEMSNGLQSSR